MCYLLNRTQTKMPNLLLTTVNIRFSFYIFRKKGAARLTYYVLLQFNQKEKGTCWGISYNAKGRGHDPFNPTPLMLENKKTSPPFLFDVARVFRLQYVIFAMYEISVQYNANTDWLIFPKISQRKPVCFGNLLVSLTIHRSKFFSVANSNKLNLLKVFKSKT